jgi:hypothetical protein
VAADRRLGRGGDSLLLPAEGLSRARIVRRFASPLWQRLLLGRGLVSDGTEHAFLTAQCLARHPGDPAAFALALAWRLRWWFAALPPGIGMATAMACIRPWYGCGGC